MGPGKATTRSHGIPPLRLGLFWGLFGVLPDYPGADRIKFQVGYTGVRNKCSMTCLHSSRLSWSWSVMVLDESNGWRVMRLEGFQSSEVW